MKITKVIIQILLLVSALFGCTENNNVMSNPQNVLADPLLPSLDVFSVEQDTYVVVLFGYGYNEGDKKDALLAQLDETYGLIQNDGIIIPFVYPDDFVSFGYERISLLPENIQSILLEETALGSLEQVSTLVTIGSPDSTHYALAELHDTVEGLRVFSVFSQDDILGTESGSTLVIDYNINLNNQQEGYESLGEIDLSYPGDVFAVISPLINASLDWDRVTESGLFVPSLRSEYTKKTDCSFFVYVDPQTGLRSENHFVLAQKDNP